MALITGAMLWYTQIPVSGSFAANLLVGYLLMGVGMAFAFIPMSIAALAGVEQREAGLASGLNNTSQQIGGALGVAVVSTIAFTHATSLLKTGESQASAYTSGFALAFWVLAGVGAAAVVATLLLVRPVPEAAVEAEAAEAAI
jgi:predicted MFS family arabinose efflux permease